MRHTVCFFESLHIASLISYQAVHLHLGVVDIEVRLSKPAVQRRKTSYVALKVVGSDICPRWSTDVPIIAYVMNLPVCIAN